MNYVYLGDKRVNVPGNWNELNRSQAIELAKQLSKRMPVAEALQRIWIILLETKKHLWIQWFLLWKATPIERQELDQLSTWVFENKLLTNDVLQYIDLGFTKLYGPGNLFEKTSYLEFIKADAYFKKYNETKNEEYLNQFVASLYRPKKRFIWFYKMIGSYDGDCRIKFNQYVVEQYAKKLKNVPTEVKTVVMWYWIGCMETIVANNRDIFPEQGGEPSQFGWVEALMKQSGGLFGDLDKTMHTRFNTVLIDLKVRNNDAKKLEAQYKK
jgi:hypothetical protein